MEKHLSVVNNQYKEWMCIRKETKLYSSCICVNDSKVVETAKNQHRFIFFNQVAYISKVSNWEELLCYVALNEKIDAQIMN